MGRKKESEVIYPLALLSPGLKAFLRHTTGSEIPRKPAIKVDFMQDEHGAITAHTCANTIILPRGTFMDESEETMELFRVAMEATIQGGTKRAFNTV